MSSLTEWGQRVADAVGRILAQRRRPPIATYRIQFEPGRLTFRVAADLVSYLDELGISHLYASPCLKTRSRSPHGYAIADYGQLNPELGSSEDYRALIDALHARGMGQILDVVPNHMSATVENAWWRDVLENGPSSPYAAHFDIDWRPLKDELQDKVLLPILGQQYGKVLESGELKLEYREGEFIIRYYETAFPLEPRSYRSILAHRLDELKQSVPPDSEDLRELESILTALEHLPAYTETDPARVAERGREKEVVKSRIRNLVGRCEAIGEFLRRNVAELNGSPDDPHSFDRLDQLLDAQPYRLAHWRAAADEINYRRFFDLNDLAAVCMEERKVFEESHRLVFELLVRGDVDGLRIDHIDGLYDPTEYLRRLQWGHLRALGRASYERVAGDGPESPTPPAPRPPLPAWSDVEPAFLDILAHAMERAPLPLYVVVEKILGPEEPLPDHWPVAGTTGYDFLRSANGLFVDRSGLEKLTQAYCRFIDKRPDFREVVYPSKLLILRTAMSSDLQLLAHRLNRISERHRQTRDFTLHSLRTALLEILACFPVYRTYIREGEITERDRQFVCRAVAQAKRRHPALDAAFFDFVRDVLLLQAPPGLDEAGRRERELFVGRFQQLTSPVMAKGVEDTAFYRYSPLSSLCEVGGDPAGGPTGVEEFHRQNLARQARWPFSLLATTTHDAKRSEDLRARINVLSEIPAVWRAAVNRWARLNRRHRREVAGQPAPCRNDEYLFYQSLLGVWPLDVAAQNGSEARSRPKRQRLGKRLLETLAGVRSQLSEFLAAGRQLTTNDRGPATALAERLLAYMEKATREAKVHTSWVNPDPEYDAAVREFVAAVLDDPTSRFLASFREFHGRVVDCGLYTALAQTFLKLTSPGVPDIYQGQEIWDFSLVDPDNRRPVDFALCRRLLAELKSEASRGGEPLAALASRLARSPRDPRLKLFVTWRTLEFRRRHAELFQRGEYIPLEVQGPRARHVCAFARRVAGDGGRKTGDGRPVPVVVAPRLIGQLMPFASDSPSSPPPPLGAAIWQDTCVALGDLGLSRLTNVFTGQVLTTDDSRLSMAAALSDFPVGLFC